MKHFFTILAFLSILDLKLFAQDRPRARQIGDAYIENTGGKDD